MTGILVHGSNHFIVRGPLPDRAASLALATHWSHHSDCPRLQTDRRRLPPCMGGASSRASSGKTLRGPLSSQAMAKSHPRYGSCSANCRPAASRFTMPASTIGDGAPLSHAAEKSGTRGISFARRCRLRGTVLIYPYACPTRARLCSRIGRLSSWPRPLPQPKAMAWFSRYGRLRLPQTPRPARRR